MTVVRQILPSGLYRAGQWVMHRSRELRMRIRPSVAYHGQSFCVNPADLGVSWELWKTGSFDPALVDMCLGQVAAGDVVIDAGANIGVFSIPLALAVGAGGLVMSCEPEMTNFEILSRNIANTGLSHVVPIKKGLAEAERTVRLHLSKENKGMHSISVGAVRDLAGSQEIVLTTLDTLVAERGMTRLDFLKVDVQGAEAMLIAGATRTLQRFRPVIFLEYSEDACQACGGDGPAMIAQLEALDYGFELANAYAGTLTACTGAQLVEWGRRNEINFLARPQTSASTRRGTKHL